MSEMRFEVTGQSKAEIDRAARTTIQRFTGEAASLVDLTISARPVYCIGGKDVWIATVHYEW